jgi:Peptidase family M28
MEAARPRGRRRRPRRGTVSRPVNTRLVRVAAVVVAPALLAVLFSVSTTGVLPRPVLEPLFDGEAAAELATRLSTEYPDRRPGSLGAEGAARWYHETIAGIGLAVEEDAWTEDVPGLGPVELRNVVTVVPGRSEEAVVIVAHRDNSGAGRSETDNAAATAALIELARGYTPQATAPAALPARTLVLVSTDAGAYGGAGAGRFARESPYADDAIAVVVLDAFDRGRPLLAIAADEPVSPARALVRTAAARIEEQTGVKPSLPTVPVQLVDLAIPYAGKEQGPFLAEGISAITISTRSLTGAGGLAEAPSSSQAVAALDRLGRATEALVSSIDASVGAAFRTPDSLFFDDRAASGWAVRLTLVLAVVPFALGIVDLIARGRRRGLPFRPALRNLRARALFWGYGGLLLWLGGLLGAFPTGAALAIPPAMVSDWPVAGLALLAAALALGWLTARRRLVPLSGVTAEERLAGYSVALGWIGVVAVVLAIAKPYGLVFVLPSLYAWLWLPIRSRLWARLVLYALGLMGPFAGLALLAHELDIGLVTALLYVGSLATVGYVSVGSVVLGLAWAAGAAQLGALAAGRYAPYAGGVEPPPAGIVRQSLGRLGRYVSAR